VAIMALDDPFFSVKEYVSYFTPMLFIQ